MNTPFVSIVILNYNGLKDLKECFDSLLNLTYKNIELIFVDNNSKDKSVDFVKKNYRNVKIIELHKNYGFSQGNNFGAKAAKGDYIVILNNDTIVDKNWISEMVKTAQESKKVGIIGSKIYYYDDQKTINFAGSLCDRYGRTTHIGKFQMDSSLLNIQRKIFYACGASLMISRELYEKITLFDPTYFIYYEDVDVCWRAWIFGYDVVYTPTSFIYHKIGRAIKSNKFKKYLAEKNKLRTILKNYEIKTILKILPGYLLERFTRIYDAIFYKTRTSSIWFRIYLKAIFWNIVHIKSLIKYRKFIQSNRKINDKLLFQIMKELSEFEKKPRIFDS